jgi:beta-glucanase (GH16 family)
LVFADDFQPWSVSSTGSGTDRWNVFSVSGSTPPSDAVYYKDGVANLVWKHGQGSADTSMITAYTGGKHELGFHYGYVEAQFRWTVTPGSWPAFWLLPVDHLNNSSGEPDFGELDVFEAQGNSHDYFGTVHEWLNGKDVASNNCCNLHVVPSMAGYHTYGALWVPGRVSWYLDNKLLGSSRPPGIFDSNTKQLYHLILGAQEGVYWTYGRLFHGKPTQLSMEVRWVRVWQKR